jgi:YD repeat-containing protein
VSYRYDERACLVEATNAYKHSLRYDFDVELRLAQKTDRRGYAFHFLYDAEGRCVESRGADGAEAVKIEYRPVERTTLVTRHDGGTWRYQYDDSGSISNILDPYEGLQSYLFDRRGRVTEEIDPLGNSTRFRFQYARRCRRKGRCLRSSQRAARRPGGATSARASRRADAARA